MFFLARVLSYASFMPLSFHSKGHKKSFGTSSPEILLLDFLSGNGPNKKTISETEIVLYKIINKLYLT